jgi:hypothetical protein
VCDVQGADEEWGQVSTRMRSQKQWEERERRRLREEMEEERMQAVKEREKRRRTVGADGRDVRLAGAVGGAVSGFISFLTPRKQRGGVRVEQRAVDKEEEEGGGEEEEEEEGVGRGGGREGYLQGRASKAGGGGWLAKQVLCFTAKCL